MGLETSTQSNKIFATVISDGSIRVKVDENTPGAVKREYEDRDKIKHEKWEKVYQSLTGIITSIKFKDSDFGQFLDIEINDIILSLNTDGGFAQDLMKKLPKVDLSGDVKLAPYAFTTESGKNLKGITVYQNNEKLTSFFWDGENSINGLPVVTKEEGAKYKKDNWKIFFTTVKMFLIDYTEKNIIPKIKSKDEQFKETLDKAGIAYTDITPDDSMEDSFDPSSIPF